MQAEERQPDPVAAPQRYRYFRLMHLLRGQGAMARVVNDVSLAFPVADIAGCQDDAVRERRGVEADDGWRGAECGARGALGEGGRSVCVRPAFMGLLGVAGALPFHYTERIAAAADSGPREFVDMLSARALEQFDEAWHRQRPRREALAGMIAALRQPRTVSAPAIGRELSEYFEVPVRLQQFVGRQEVLPLRDQLALGAGNCVIGDNAGLGERQWRCDLRVCLHVGPLDADCYEEFLPGAAGARALCDMVASLLRGDAAGCRAEVRVVLAASGVRPVRLGAVGWQNVAEARAGAAPGPAPAPGAGADVGATGAGAGSAGWAGAEATAGAAAGVDSRRGGAARLGYNAFLLTSNMNEPRSELRYRL